MTAFHPSLRMATAILATALAVGTVAAIEGCASDPTLPAEVLACGQAIQAAVAGADNTDAKTLAASEVALTNASCIALGTDATNALVSSFGKTGLTTAGTPAPVPAVTP